MNAIWSFILALFGQKSAQPAQKPWVAAWQLKGMHAGVQVVAGTGPEYGGAIATLQWGGHELINPTDGRGGQIQSAYYLDTVGDNYAENPTEAGSGLDGDGPTSGTPPTPSSTIIRSASVETGPEGMVLRTAIHPAQWFLVNGQRTSRDVMTKVCTLGYRGMTNVLRHQYSLTLDAAHSNFSVEGLCHYMPPGMNTWHELQDDGSLRPVSLPAGKSEQSTRLHICANPDGSLATTGFSRQPNSVNWWGMDQQYPKWTVGYFGLSPVSAGQIVSWEAFAIFGTLQSVRDTLIALKKIVTEPQVA